LTASPLFCSACPLMMVCSRLTALTLTDLVCRRIFHRSIHSVFLRFSAISLLGAPSCLPRGFLEPPPIIFVFCEQVVIPPCNGSSRVVVSVPSVLWVFLGVTDRQVDECPLFVVSRIPRLFGPPHTCIGVIYDFVIAGQLLGPLCPFRNLSRMSSVGLVFGPSIASEIPKQPKPPNVPQLWALEHAEFVLRLLGAPFLPQSPQIRDAPAPPPSLLRTTCRLPLGAIFDHGFIR